MAVSGLTGGGFFHRRRDCWWRPTGRSTPQRGAPSSSPAAGASWSGRRNWLCSRPKPCDLKSETIGSRPTAPHRREWSDSPASPISRSAMVWSWPGSRTMPIWVVTCLPVRTTASNRGRRPFDKLRRVRPPVVVLVVPQRATRLLLSRSDNSIPDRDTTGSSRVCGEAVGEQKHPRSAGRQPATTSSDSFCGAKPMVPSVSATRQASGRARSPQRTLSIRIWCRSETLVWSRISGMGS